MVRGSNCLAQFYKKARTRKGEFCKPLRRKTLECASFLSTHDILNEVRFSNIFIEKRTSYVWKALCIKAFLFYVLVSVFQKSQNAEILFLLCDAI